MTGPGASPLAPFVHVNVHSGFSFAGGTLPIEALVARAAADGHTALALTDVDGCYGLPAFQVACDAVNVKALHGVELHDPPLPAGAPPEGVPERDGPARAVVLVEDDRGYRNLCRLVTARHLDPRFRLVDALRTHAQGLIVLTPSTWLLERLAGELAGDRLYAEVHPVPPGGAGQATRVRRRRLLELAHAHGLAPMASLRAFLDRPERHALHRLRLAIAHLMFVRDVVPGARGREGHPIDLVSPRAWLRPPEEAARAFRDLPEAVEATRRVAERLTFRFVKPSRPRLPRLDLVAAAADPKEAEEAAYARLAALALEGLTRRYGRIRADALARLERELRVIRDRGFSDYFLIVHGLAGFARERSIPCVGRGSAASSLTAYALGLTSVDPLRYDLPFERFLSPARRDCPDIDLDIDWRGREAVIEHAYATYGEHRVAMISTHVTFQARAAVREAARALGLAPAQVDRLVAHLPWRLASALDPERRPPELHAFALDRPPWRDVLVGATGLEGLPRHLSIHVGGIVIGDGPLTDTLPLERSGGRGSSAQGETGAGGQGRVITQYEMHGVEATGLVKIDLLGNRALAVVADVAREALAQGEPIELDALPEDDAPAGALLASGGTLGCFQVESPGMRNLVVRLGARTQEDAMIALSLIRPGPAGSGMKDAYVRRRRGEEATPAVHPTVDPLFATTHGVMLYQEDTLRVAAAVAGFDLAQADQLRRALSKKREPEDLPEMERAFRVGAAGRGVPPEVVEHVWRSIKQFSAYAYNKAHAATYARISWQMLWLKARKPAEFLAAVLRNEGGFYPARAYVEEARRLGCRIELPCVNRSDVGPEGRRGNLRLGLGQVKGLRDGTPEALVRLRGAQGPFLSPTDLLLRSTLEKAEVERLIVAGALDIFDRPRGELLWHVLLDFERYAKARAEATGRTRTALFGPTALLPPQRHIPVPPTLTPEQLLAMEIEALGLTASCHPFELVEQQALEAGAVPISELTRHVDETVRVAGWVVTDRRVRVRARSVLPEQTLLPKQPQPPQPPQAPQPPRAAPTGAGATPRQEGSLGRRRAAFMKFLMLEDKHGTVEVTVFPRIYARVGHRLVGAGPFLVTGRVRDDHGALTLDAKDVTRLETTA
jgi:DNA-directed DNA polymerase III PolC